MGGGCCRDPLTQYSFGQLSPNLDSETGRQLTFPRLWPLSFSKLLLSRAFRVQGE